MGGGVTSYLTVSFFAKVQDEEIVGYSVYCGFRGEF